jgi:(1->4)-alpha-D-glucan 1-alpha-D-glucosylmutase
LHAGFNFDDAANVADYLKDLGVSHVYCSPYLQAAPGSMHGYDVVDHEKVNDELGGEAGLKQFSGKLREIGLGQILDIVPNHMALGPRNRYWWDLLENGASSRYADWFDIDWHMDNAQLRNKILIPVLGDQYGLMLSAGQITLEQEDGAFRVRYTDHKLPVAPWSLAGLLRRAADYAHDDMLNFIADSFARLPRVESMDRSAAIMRDRDKAVIYGLLKRRCQECGEACQAVAQAVDELNHDADALDQLLNEQNYRLAYWRTADQELGYRRFFDVTSLIGLRVEREHVFLTSHSRIIEWLRNGQLAGVRVDHPDGLRNPQQYFERLHAQAPAVWIVAEKILEPGESLRETWPIHGTSGYDFLSECNSLMVHGDGLKALTEIYQRFTDELIDFESLAREKKLNVQHEALGSDVNRLAALFAEICANNRDHRDYTLAEIRRALREVAASFSVYRTYVIAERNSILDEDRNYIDAAVAQARERRQDLSAGLFDFIGDVLTLRARGDLENDFLMRFQQFTPPVMAKGVEDTAFYCFNRMIGLNEVGGNPAGNGITLDDFHRYCSESQVSHPSTMLTLSTHDTKRADDVRARLATLTEIPDQWRTVLKRWSRMNTPFRTGPHPDRNTEYFLYQTLIGAWPISKERLSAYMLKAMREAKQQTSWTQQNQDFEAALSRFIECIMESQGFLAALGEFVTSLTEAGRINSLAQTLIKLTAPGVPDTYQGGELWDLTLVDPDNRQPVDYDLRRQMLGELQAGMEAEEILSRSDSGLPKLWVIHAALCLRRAHPAWFGENAKYTPVVAEGKKSEHLVGFLRGDSVATLVPRWSLKLNGNWANTTVTLPEGIWRNVLTRNELVAGGRVSARDLFKHFPVALLAQEPGEQNASL